MKRLRHWVGAVAAFAGVGLGIAAHAAAPPGRYVVTAETVLDTKTGLTWQREPSPTLHSWSSGKGYCTSLSLAGQSGWRLPTIKELQSIVDIRASDPAIDSAAFPDTPAAGFWSTTTFVYLSNNGWVVHFGAGNSNSSNEFNAHQVRCVR